MCRGIQCDISQGVLLGGFSRVHWCVGEYSASTSLRVFFWDGSAESIGVSENTVRNFYMIIREQIAADVRTSFRIGGPGTIVEIDEVKFGKRPVHGSWILGGIKRDTDSCFLTLCPVNVRDEPTLKSSNSGCYLELLSSATAGEVTGT